MRKPSPLTMPQTSLKLHSVAEGFCLNYGKRRSRHCKISVNSPGRYFAGVREKTGFVGRVNVRSLCSGMSGSHLRRMIGIRPFCGKHRVAGAENIASNTARAPFLSGFARLLRCRKDLGS